MKLLIVDDQHSVHMFLDKMLSEHNPGLSGVLHAYNGKEALNLLETFHPDIMMLDVKMPLMDGIETLREIRFRGIQVHTMILSAYNEFEYARQALLYNAKDYLLKPIDWIELQDKLTKLIQQVRTNSVFRLKEITLEYLNGQESIPEIFSLQFEKLGISGYGFLCFRTDDERMDLRMEGVGQIYTVSSEELGLSLMSADKPESWNDLLQRFISNNMHFLGASRFQNDPMQAAEAMRQAVAAIQQGFYEPGVYLYEENAFSDVSPGLDMELARQTQEAYLKGDIQEVKILVERLFHVFRKTRARPAYVQEFCYGFLLRLNKDYITTFQQMKKSRFISEFNCYDSMSLKNAMLRIILNMCCDLEAEEASTDSDVVCRIKTYIDLHYDRDLSLETMSKHFFIGKYQISRIFKKKFEINYSDYILKVRMENAALLLTSTSCKLYEVAHKTGFDETSYFSNVFKKYYGSTPNEYRKGMETEDTG